MTNPIESISRDELRKRLEMNNIALVEVLDREQYAKFHLPGAICVPVSADDFGERIEKAVPDKDQPVVVYCMDTACDASARAAEKLRVLGYEKIFDYEEGKQGWKAAGLPIEA